MNKQQAEGALQDIAGKIQQQTGKLLHSKALEIKGLRKQVVGKAERQLGDASEVRKDKLQCTAS